MNLSAVAGAIMVLVFAYLTAASSNNISAVAAQDGAALFGLLTALFTLMATMSVRVDGDELTLVSVVRCTTIPASKIRSASGLNGLEVVTDDGQILGHFGYGSSILGTFTGNRRATTVAKRINEWRRTAEDVSSPRSRASVTRRPRKVALVAFPVLGLSVPLVASLVHAVVV